MVKINRYNGFVALVAFSCVVLGTLVQDCKFPFFSYFALFCDGYSIRRAIPSSIIKMCYAIGLLAMLWCGEIGSTDCEKLTLLLLLSSLKPSSSQVSSRPKGKLHNCMLCHQYFLRIRCNVYVHFF